MMQVVNGYQNNWEGYYIGREHKGLGFAGSPLGNYDYEIPKFRETLYRSIKQYQATNRPDAKMAELIRLIQIEHAGHDVQLCCFCKPNPCHDDVIVSAAAWLQTQPWFLERLATLPPPESIMLTTVQPLFIPALSIKQPYADLIVDGHKNLENREWSPPPKYFGKPILIHAGRQFYVNATDHDDYAQHYGIPDSNQTQRGGFIGWGILEKVITVQELAPEYVSWFEGEFGFVFTHVQRIDFIEAKGRLNFFNALKCLQTPLTEDEIYMFDERAGIKETDGINTPLAEMQAFIEVMGTRHMQQAQLRQGELRYE